MRPLTTAASVRRLMSELGRVVRKPVSVFFTGGATAVLHGWRESTIDVDLKAIPDSDELLRALPRIKEEVQINVELAAPSDFIPEVPGWRERSLFVQREGTVSFFHYDLYAQALAKIDRGHAQDVADVKSMFASGLVRGDELLELFERIEPELYRYPAIDPASFREGVEAAVTQAGG